MSSSRLRGPGRVGSVARRWFAIALAVFLLVDAGLVVWALNDRARDSSGSAASDDGMLSSRTPTPTASSASTPISTPTPTSSAQANTMPPTRTLDAVSSEVAWRAETNGCPGGPAIVEVTQDGGESWSDSDAGTNTDARSVLRIVAESASEATTVVLRGDNCDSTIVGTYVGGAEWEEYPDRLPRYWLVNPGDRATVVTSAGAKKAPCDTVIAVAPRDENVGAVLCSNQAFHVTQDSGESWSKAVKVDGAVTLTATNSGYAVAVINQGDCAGLSIVAVSGDTVGSPRGCTGADVSAGDVAISEADNTLWAWVADELFRSNDGGESWS